MDAYVIHSMCFSEPAGKAREVAIGTMAYKRHQRFKDGRTAFFL